jgi:PIN domain nuclease of toxin-antitoxin system
LILLDTHVVFWLSADPARLSRSAGSAIRRAKRASSLAISAISLWELALLATRSRFEVTGTIESFLEELSSRVAVCPITPKVAALAHQLPADYPNDPCDRLIGATALAEGMVLITKDERIRACKLLRTIW